MIDDDPVYEFDRAVAARGPAGEGDHARIPEGWDVRGITNGGYLLSAITVALRPVARKPDPVSVSAHYLAPSEAGRLWLATHDGRHGRRHATLGATVSQEQGPVAQVIATFADLTPQGRAVDRVEMAPPSLPDPDACQPRRGFADEGLGQRLDLRLHPDDAGFGDGRPSGHSRTRGWIRFRDGRPPDTLALLLFADAFPPAVFNAGLPVGWTPTVQLTVHVRGRPAPGWIRASFTTRAVAGGYLEEDGELWDAEDRLVAQSRQLAVLPRAPEA